MYDEIKKFAEKFDVSVDALEDFLKYTITRLKFNENLRLEFYRNPDTTLRFIMSKWNDTSTTFYREMLDENSDTYKKCYSIILKKANYVNE